ncbi:MAG: hypothetical protein EOO05_06825 [Chitinophagaceae bacterium]|nr:MAG: hypothetical protein EOO05_06825 [Chitinophagaceae bacterium]
MKRILLASAVLLSTFVSQAQDLASGDRRIYDPRFLDAFGILFTFVLIVFFVLAIFKRVFDYRLKNKVIDKQVTEGMAMSVLGSAEPKEGRFINVKWFAILGGIGAGLLIVHYTQPLGIHSLAIMFLSISFSFLGYHLFLSRQNKSGL